MEEFQINLEPNLDEAAGKMAEVQEPAQEAANRVASIARSSAPVDSGEYESKIRVEKTTRGYRVVADDFKSAWIEFGVPSRGIPARFNLRNAAVSAGLSFRKRGG